MRQSLRFLQTLVAKHVIPHSVLSSIHAPVVARALMRPIGVRSRDTATPRLSTMPIAQPADFMAEKYAEEKVLQQESMQKVSSDIRELHSRLSYWFRDEAKTLLQIPAAAERIIKASAQESGYPDAARHLEYVLNVRTALYNIWFKNFLVSEDALHPRNIPKHRQHEYTGEVLKQMPHPTPYYRSPELLAQEYIACADVLPPPKIMRKILAEASSGLWFVSSEYRRSLQTFTDEMKSKGILDERIRKIDAIEAGASEVETPHVTADQIADMQISVRAHMMKARIEKMKLEGGLKEVVEALIKLSTIAERSAYQKTGTNVFYLAAVADRALIAIERLIETREMVDPKDPLYSTTLTTFRPWIGTYSCLNERAAADISTSLKEIIARNPQPAREELQLAR